MDDDYTTPPGYTIVGWYCPRGSGHLEQYPEKMSATPLLMRTGKAAEAVKDIFARDYADD